MIWPAYGPVTPPVIAPLLSWPHTVFQLSTSTNLSTAWGTANLAEYFAIVIPEPFIATKLWWQNGATVSGNIDVGIYDDQQNRIVSARADAGADIAQSGTSAIQSRDIADTLIPAGLIYFGIVCSSATATLWMTATGGNGYTANAHIQTSAHPLPATATFATVNGVALPKFGALAAPRTVL